MRGIACLSIVAALLAGCADRPVGIASTPMPAPAVTEPMPMPLPPSGAAAGLVIPERLVDGSFATSNRLLSPARTVWHLRAALNVAALRCADPVLLADYNRFLAAQRTALAAAHRDARAEAGSEARFDAAMTRLYNYWALPPVHAAFCAAAATVAGQAVTEAPADLAAFSPWALALLDAPLIEFFDRYDQYRVELAVWRAGPQAPRLDYDTAVMTSEGPLRARETILALAAR